MKKLIMFILTTALLAASATAEAPGIETGKIVRLEPGAVYDLDGDGMADEVSLATGFDADGMEYFTLTVNAEVQSGYGDALTGEVWALRLHWYDGTMLLVSEYGPSDDDLTRFFLYEDGRLLPVGEIGALPQNMRAAGGIITAPVRGKVLYTWFHEADFALARGFRYDEDGEIVMLDPCLYGIPRHMYPMGLIVTLKVDLPLRAARTDAEASLALPAGTQAVLCASDDVKWVYIQTPDGAQGGWLELAGEYGINCLVGNTEMMGFDVFDGLWLAD